MQERIKEEQAARIAREEEEERARLANEEARRKVEAKKSLFDHAKEGEYKQVPNVVLLTNAEIVPPLSSLQMIPDCES